jgi:SNF2 family DNA or RNA helicase
MRWQWHRDGSVLKLRNVEGADRVLSTEEIYAALVQHQPIESGIPTTLSGVRASRYPLNPTLVIDDTDGDGVPTVSISGTCRGKSISLSAVDLDRGHLVADDVWYPIEPEQATELGAMLQTLSISTGHIKSLKSFLALRKSISSELIDDKLLDRPISPLAFMPSGDELPDGVEAQLYPYQASGWRWLKFLLAEEVGGLLADEMGLGKTLQIISALRDGGNGPVYPALIAAPGSLLENWNREIAKFAPSLKVLKHHGPDRTGRPTDLRAYDIVVTSYDNVVRDNGLLNMIEWQVIVLDEAQYIRNPMAQRTKAVKALPRKVGIAVTGTPIENRLLDLWSIMDFILPDHLGDVASFQKRFQEDLDGASALEPRVSPLMLRRRVADVAQDLPPRIDIPQIIELDEEEASRYERLRARIADEYGAAATLVALTSMRRFCAHPALVDPDHHAADPVVFSKFRRLDELVEEIFAINEKVIIFSTFTKMADMISQHIAKRHNAFTGVIDGRLPIDQRQPLIDAFGSVRGSAALVLNPKAGGAGLNITAANHVVHYNPEWNPALEDQASARAHRRGQDKPVTIHRLLVANTVEDVINERLMRKRAISGAAIVGIEGGDEDYADLVAALWRSPLAKRER